MSKKDKNILKEYFDPGDVPTSQQFANLIDSFVHVDSYTAGLLSYPDKATMDADGSQPDGTPALVTNDPDITKNGFYRWDDGGATWVKADLTTQTLDPQDGSTWLTGKAVADWRPARLIKQWASNIVSTGVGLSNITYSNNENLKTADITWPDGKQGTVSDLQENADGDLTSIRFNYDAGNGKYVTITRSYDANRNITDTNINATGF